LGGLRTARSNKAVFELAFQLALAPIFLNGLPQIEFTLFRVLALTEDNEIMCPGKLSHQWRDNFITLISLVKLPHSKQIRARKASNSWLDSHDMSRQLSDNVLSPFGSFYLAANGFTDLPIQINQGDIDCLKRFLTRTLNEFYDLAKRRGRCLV
jgi:hypothetical protein